VRGPHDNEVEREGGRAAERLREFLAKRLPPGVSVDEIQGKSPKRPKSIQAVRTRTGHVPCRMTALTNNKKNSGDFGRQV